MVKSGKLGRAWKRFFRPPASVNPSALGSAERPSIVVILIDALRYDYLGLYGFNGDISPNLDQFASECVVFTHCFSPAPWTKPVVASLFTSLYPEAHGITNHEGHYWGDSTPDQRTGILPRQATTLAETLQADGYRTAAFIANPWLVAKYGFDRGFEAFSSYPNTPEIVGAAGAWLGSLPAGAPAFAYLHLMDVHGPYAAPLDDYQTLLHSPGLGEKRTLRDEQYQAIPVHLDGEPRIDNQERRQLGAWRAKYGAGVRAVDRHLGHFLQVCRDSGIMD